MYKIMLKLNSSKEVYQWYTTSEGVYSTDSLAELAETYRTLLNTYPASTILPVHELDAEILVTITE